MPYSSATYAHKRVICPHRRCFTLCDYCKQEEDHLFKSDANITDVFFGELRHLQYISDANDLKPKLVPKVGIPRPLADPHNAPAIHSWRAEIPGGKTDQFGNVGQKDEVPNRTVSWTEQAALFLVPVFNKSGGINSIVDTNYSKPFEWLFSDGNTSYKLPEGKKCRSLVVCLDIKWFDGFNPTTKALGTAANSSMKQAMEDMGKLVKALDTEYKPERIYLEVGGHYTVITQTDGTVKYDPRNQFSAAIAATAVFNGWVSMEVNPVYGRVLQEIRNEENRSRLWNSRVKHYLYRFHKEEKSTVRTGLITECTVVKTYEEEMRDRQVTSVETMVDKYNFGVHPSDPSHPCFKDSLSTVSTPTVVKK